MRSFFRNHVLKLLVLLPLALVLNSCQGVAMLDPKGPIGVQERDLIVMSVGLGMVVIIPLFIMVGLFSFRYRESNTKATYKPHWEGNLGVEALIWLVPLAIIVVLSVLTWIKTTELDPYRPIPSVEKPVRVQVVSLDWNWLFIYPDYNIAVVNKLAFPAGTPVTFDLTSATVMTSLLIPELGSQMYAMAGMVTHLNLLSDHPGNYTGRNMEFSGEGYETMSFAANALTKDEFDAWVKSAQGAAQPLTKAVFDALNKPQRGVAVSTYSSVEPGLFGSVVDHFMSSRGQAMPEMEGGAAMPAMEMVGDAKAEPAATSHQ